jgi:thiol-disulfide isomerase/thioredoxin
MFKHKLNTYLENSKNLLYRITYDKKQLLFVTILVIIFIIVSVFVYNNYIKNFIDKNHSVNREFVDTRNTDNDVLILYFYTEWCPYCKQASSEINKFEEYIKTLNASNDFIITLTKVDCDKNSTIADKYKVENYPTIKLIYKKEVYNYDAKPTKEHLIQFLEGSIA